jgi:hypothetical protein
MSFQVSDPVWMRVYKSLAGAVIEDKKMSKTRKASAVKTPPKEDFPVSKCSFCGKSEDLVKKLVSGVGVRICNECVVFCNQILREELDHPHHLSGSHGAKEATASALDQIFAELANIKAKLKSMEKRMRNGSS